jgi:uncharacterized protein
MDFRITRFLRRHHVLTLSTSSGTGSWTAHCFYAVMQDYQALVFTSDPETRHGSELLKNPHVSGGIMLETSMVGKIRGIQLTGRAFACQPQGNSGLPDFITPEKVRHAYLKKFPYAVVAKLNLWVLQIDYIKMTDNRLGFGKKLEWRPEDENNENRSIS